LKAGCQRKNLHLGENKYKENEGNYTRTLIIITLPPKIIRVIKSRAMHFESCIGHIGRMGIAQKILVTRFYWKTDRRDLCMGGIILK
jgi:hypothetical protein